MNVGLLPSTLAVRKKAAEWIARAPISKADSTDLATCMSGADLVHTASNLADLFFRQVETLRDRGFLLHKQEGKWRSLSYREVGRRTIALLQALRREGVEPADRVAILAENRPEWFVADLAILAAGAVDVPVYATSPANEIEYILMHSGARVLFVSNAEQWHKVARLRSRLMKLELILSFDPILETDAPRSLSDFTRSCPCDDEALRAARAAIPAVGRDDLASILYTSGTTGTPKGVMLTHGNFLSNCESVLRHLEVGPTDRTLSFLPLSHSFERTAGHYAMLAAGAQIAYATSIDSVAQEVREVRPTILLGVPRFYEKVRARILGTVEKAPTVSRKLFHFACRAGRAVLEHRLKGEEIPLSLRWRLEVADKLVFGRLRRRLGGRTRFLVSGGAPIDREIVMFFQSIGVQLLEGYGLTETSPVVSCNRPDNCSPGSVGTIIPLVEVRIATDGEIMVRGPNVMKGYFESPEETRKALDEEGFFHTGDIGRLDEHGNLFITDRKKDLIITSGGKNVSPQQVENLLKRHRLIADVCLVGDTRPYCVALIVPDFAALKAFAAENGIEWKGREEILREPSVFEQIRDAVHRANESLAPPERVRRFAMLSDPFSQENRQLTPTLKVRRRAVEEHYRDLIRELYEQDLPQDPRVPLVAMRE